MLKEFKEFALKGNVIDLAVGVIIGAAFGKIVTSLVDDIILPPIGVILGGLDFSSYYIPLSDKVAPGLALAKAKEVGAVLAWGNFLTVTLNFAIVAFCIFLVVKAINTAKKRLEAEKAAAPAPGPTEDVKLLTEIRDLLKSKSL